MRVWSLGWGDPLEKELATHSSLLTWEIPWTEESGGLQSMVWPKSWTWTTTCLDYCKQCCYEHWCLFQHHFLFYKMRQLDWIILSQTDTQHSSGKDTIPFYPFSGLSQGSEALWRLGMSCNKHTPPPQTMETLSITVFKLGHETVLVAFSYPTPFPPANLFTSIPLSLNVLRKLSLEILN